LAIVLDSFSHDEDAYFSISEGNVYPASTPASAATEIFRIEHDGTVLVYNDILPSGGGSYALGSLTDP